MSWSGWLMSGTDFTLRNNINRNLMIFSGFLGRYGLNVETCAVSEESRGMGHDYPVCRGEKFTG